MLERLAGKETTEKLNVAHYMLKTQNVDLSDVNFEKREIDTNIEYLNDEK